ncbi:MAG: hypothetical protein ACYC1I_05440 [Acidimicrobiales bacterium]
MLFYRLLEQSVEAPPVTEAALLKRTKPKAKPTTPPDLKRVHADTLDLKVRPKPWRRAAAR